MPLRERALCRLLYDSAARAEEVLGLDVGDLDLANRQARARTKGGHIRPLHFQTAAARLLARLTAGRQSGPVFLTDRRAAAHRVTAAADLDPASGRDRRPWRPLTVEGGAQDDEPRPCQESSRQHGYRTENFAHPLDHLLADRDACGTPAGEVLTVVPEQVVGVLADLRLGPPDSFRSFFRRGS